MTTEPADDGGRLDPKRVKDDRRKAVIWLVGIAAVAVAIGAVLSWVSTIPDVGSTIQAITLLVVAVVGYVLPSIIAIGRKHHNAGAITAVNILLGWSLIGWVIALVWALTDPSPTVRIQLPYPGQPPPPGVQYQVGDVVNGHRFNGQTWEPLQ